MILRLVELAIEGSPAENLKKFSEAAVAPPVPDLAVLPELFTTGYMLDRIPDLALSPEDLPELLPAKIAAREKVWIVAGSLPVKSPNGVVNKMVVYNPDGKIAYTTEKVHLFSAMGEDRAFIPGKCGGTFNLSGKTAGGIICYDLRFPELTRRMTLGGASIIFVPAQWPGGRRELFRSLLRARAAESQIFAAGCNIGGEHLGVIFKGGGGVAHPTGNMLKGSIISDGITDFVIDLNDVDQIRTHIDCLSDLRPEEYGSIELAKETP
ncbi:MAG: carbon-nitrogen family hydrolase [Candidatus Aegiribacteria sp.]|nr:carbon-nitrogen family hydrolase [Candidatus Aegiribacteria sp.]